MTLLELLMGLSEALEEAEKAKPEKTEKPANAEKTEAEPDPKLKTTQNEPTVFVLHSNTTTIANGVCINHNDGCHGVFADSMSAMRHAISVCGTGKLLFEKSDNNTYLATEMFNDDGMLVYSEYTVGLVPFKS